MVSKFPKTYKQARTRPLLIKYCYYWPISNLSFICKLIENSVFKQLNAYLRQNYLHGNCQSASLKGLQYGTALLRVHNDMLSALIRHNEVILNLLDLNATFGTIDHIILLRRLFRRFGISG